MKNNNSSHNKICIIGAGLAGLSAAYDLGRKGYKVTILEANSEIGGLASSINLEDLRIERFYHFVCTSDSDLLELVDELGLNNHIHWSPTKTSFFYSGKLYSFGSPLDLLRFSPVPFIQRIRFGLNIINSRYRRIWQKLDRISAKSWLTQQIGEQAYQVIWDPLLRIKFGRFHDQISAAWIWHRIHRVASSRRKFWEGDYLGYLENGSETLIVRLLEFLEKMPNVHILTDTRVDRIQIEGGKVIGVELMGQEQAIACSQVISTIALELLSKIAPDIPDELMSKIDQIDYLGVICGLLKLRRPLTDSFWVNVNDREIPFNGFIEYSNLNKHLNRRGKHILYVPYYIPTSDPRFSYTDDQLKGEIIAGVEKIQPEFDETWIEEFLISRAAQAQAICSVNFSELVLQHRTPVDGLFITDSSQYYPEDRTISAAIRLGRRVADIILEGGKGTAS